MDTNKLLEIIDGIIEEVMECKKEDCPRACKEYFSGYDYGYIDALKDVAHEIKYRVNH